MNDGGRLAIDAGGTFSAIRPPGSPAGTNERRAVNFAALDAATGQPTSCDLSFTVGSGLATVRALAVSPDHKTLYAGGRFGAVNGVKVSNVAAIDIKTCTPKAGFRPSVNATVRALAATDGNVYLGGDFSTVAGQANVLIVPDLDAGNMLAKSLTFLAGAYAAGIVLGAKVPVILTSRADSEAARLASCAVASMLAQAGRDKLIKAVG